jgi:aspartokinase/homoserine dehydrogenase 1
VGQALLDLLAHSPERFGRLRVVAVADRGGLIHAAAGLDPASLRRIADHKRAGASLASLGGQPGDGNATGAWLSSQSFTHPVVVDLTAADTTDLLTRLAAQGFDVILANKRPLAGPDAAHQALLDAVRQGGGTLRHEATVGAGLPLLVAIRQLVETGDRIHELSGVLSGTLGAVLTALDRGHDFSAAVWDARAAGMTEPDPRDDLSGLDVARKAVILARAIGMRIEPEQVPTTSLVSGDGSAPLADWLGALPTHDPAWRQAHASAAGRGAVLRYVATITADTGATVGLEEVAADNPLAALHGPTNRLVIRSDRYHRHPLVISGPGAGPVVTATAVLADLLDVSRSA